MEGNTEKKEEQKPGTAAGQGETLATVNQRPATR